MGSVTVEQRGPETVDEIPNKVPIRTWGKVLWRVSSPDGQRVRRYLPWEIPSRDPWIGASEGAGDTAGTCLICLCCLSGHLVSGW